MNHSYRGLIIIGAGVLLLGRLSAPQEGGDTVQAVSICDLFKDLKSYNGKMISVRGLLYSGKEISALGGRCESKFVTDIPYGPNYPFIPRPVLRYAWPAALDLVPSSLVDAGEVVVEFQTDYAVVNRNFDLIRLERSRLGKRDLDVWLTVVGKLRVKPEYGVMTMPDGTLKGSGFGHLGTYPGQLVIKTTSDPKVEPR